MPRRSGISTEFVTVTQRQERSELHLWKSRHAHAVGCSASFDMPSLLGVGGSRRRDQLGVLLGSDQPLADEEPDEKPVPQL